MIAEKVDLSKYIEIRNNRPNIRGRRFPVMHLISYQRTNLLTLEELCDDFSLSEAEVLAAFLYYRQNKDEMDRQAAEDSKAWEEQYERYIHDRQK
ncbi:MAG: DUF433 domain-containing protein [Anaerolineae bacterium]|nr:DUF433 domain-containing protein [Anaerolineae bacterium]